MFGDGSLTFHEFAMREPLPLATIHDAVLEYLRGRKDAVLFGSHAVNAYVSEARMTQDVDVLSTRGKDFAEELRKFLTTRFSIALSVTHVGDQRGFRIAELRQPFWRHLVDVRPIGELPPCKKVNEVQVLAPAELIASKVLCMVTRAKTPKGGSDKADLYRLLLAFPGLKVNDGAVTERLNALGCAHVVLAAWGELVDQDIQPDNADDKFDY